MTACVLLALGPAVLATSPATTPPADVPMAVAQPLAKVPTPGSIRSPSLLSDPSVLLLVGSALMGLASIVRRTTKT
jgi:hypothetical protein